MPKRFVDTDIWEKEWFMSCTPTEKCLVKYVRDKCDLAGIWKPNFTLATYVIGSKVDEEMLLNIDNGNQFAMGGPQYGTFDVDGKTFGYIRSSPTSITKFEIKPSESTTERNYNFRVGINEALTNKILTGDPKDRLEAKGMWNSLGYQPNEFETYAGQVAAQPEGAGMTQEQQARALLAEAGGDKDKARKLAKDRGIKF